MSLRAIKTQQRWARVARIVTLVFVAGVFAQPLSAGEAVARRRQASAAPKAKPAPAIPAKAPEVPKARRGSPDAPSSWVLSDRQMERMVGGCCGSVTPNNDDMGMPCNLGAAGGSNGSGGGPCGNGGNTGGEAGLVSEKSCVVTEGSGADPVNLTSGNEIYSPGPDVVARNTRGTPVSFKRVYNSRDDRVGPFGRGWTHNWNLYLSFPGGGMMGFRPVLLNWWDGYENTWTQSINQQTQEPIPGWLTPPADERSTLYYDQYGVYTLTLPSGEKYLFNSSGTLTAHRDRNGNEITCSYDNGLLIGLTDASDRTTTIEWGEGNTRIMSVADPTGREVTYGFDEDDRLNSVTCWDGRWVEYGYVSAGMGTPAIWLGEITTERGTATIAYGLGGTMQQSMAHQFTNEEGNTWEQVPVDGTTTEVTGLSTEGTPNVWRQTHDSAARDTGIIYSDGSRTTRTYDAAGNLTSVTDRQGSTTSYTFNGSNRLTKVTDPQGNETLYTYTAAGDVATVTDSYGKVTSFTYDNNRNLLTVTDPLDRETVFTYNQYGERTSVTTPGGLATTYAYDTNGNVESVTDAAEKTTEFTHDVHGNRLTVTTPDEKTTTYTFDSADRVTQVLHPDTKTREFTYGCCGVETATDENLKVTTYEYTPLGKVASVTDPAERTTALYYTQAGQIARVVDAKGNERRWQYDSQNRLTGITQQYESANFPAEPALLESYDYVSGVLAAKTDANSDTIQLAHDSLGRLVRKRCPDDKVVGFDYDAQRFRTRRARKARKHCVPGRGKCEYAPGTRPGIFALRCDRC